MKYPKKGSLRKAPFFGIMKGFKTNMKYILTITLAILWAVLATPLSFAEGARLHVLDTTAGTPALIMVQGKPKQVIDITIATPLKTTLIQKFQASEKGVVQYWFPQTAKAGQYQVIALAENRTFVVKAGTPDMKKSKLNLTDYTAFVGKSLEGSLHLVDAFGNPLNDIALDITVQGSASVRCGNTCKTNHLGNASFVVSSTKTGLKTLQVKNLDSGLLLFEEDLGFIPLVKNPKVPERFISEEEDFIPIQNPYKATFNSQGNDDRKFWDFLSAQVLDVAAPSLESLVEETQSLALNTTRLSENTFELVLGTDPLASYEPEKSATASSALDLVVRAVDSTGKVINGYLGKIVFSVEPSGPLMPSDYSFTEIDQGVAIFELALVLPVGTYTVKVQDAINPSMKGELKINSQSQGLSLNNTNIILNLESPVSGSFYSKAISVQGGTSTDNTDITVKEGGQILKKGSVDASKRFSFPVELGDGKHQLEIVATYLVDGSTTSTTVDFEIDKTAPVISKIQTDIPSVRAGEVFSMTVEAEAESTLKALINNRAYEFTAEGTSYSLSAEAPLDPGEFPVHLQIADKFGNSDGQQNVATLTVTEPLKEVQNLFGIPGLGTVTLSWDPVKDAVNYEISPKSILGEGEVIKTDATSYTIENLTPDISYIFGVVAKDSLGNVVSLVTESKSITPLTPEKPAPPQEIHGAAEFPKQHPNSGPEVYLLIIASILLLNGYGRLRKMLIRE